MHLVPEELIIQLLVIRASGKLAADSNDSDGYFCGYCLSRLSCAAKVDQVVERRDAKLRSCRVGVQQ